MSKNSMKTLIPCFNAQRMLMDYISGFYGPASRQQALLHDGDAAPARELAAWKRRVLAACAGVSLRRFATPPTQLFAGSPKPHKKTKQHNNHTPQNHTVEC